MPLRRLAPRLCHPTLALFFAAAFAAIPAAPAGTTSAHAFSGEISLKLGYRYLLTLPAGYAAASDRRWPLVVFLHGAGERGDDLERVKRHGPPKLVAAGQEIDALILAPQVPAGETWNPHGVHQLTEAVARAHRVDPDRIYLTGISMGGFGTFETLAHYPRTYAAAIPICGGAGIHVLKFGPIRDLPIWIFHGAKDTTVPVQFSEMAANFFKRAQAPHVKLTIYPEAGHDAWTQTYDNPEVWTWLFAQRRK